VLSGIGSLFIDFAETTIDAGAYWQFNGTNTIVAGATLTNAGTLKLLGASLIDDGALVNDGIINIDPSTLTAASILGAGTIDIGANSTLTIGGTVAAGEILAFTGTNAVINILDPSGFAGTIQDQGPADQVNGLCFLAGTRIAAPGGEVPVEQLSVGDEVLTHSASKRMITWIGTGRVLATRGQRSAATPVIVRKGALAENVPNRDLHVTKGHSLYLDGALIPVESLVNHRSIEWDDRAQEVTIYHIELETHDVLIANGAPAESYRDDGNRWLFQNANAGWHLPPAPPCAPILTGGPLVDAIWRRLLDRVGPRPSLPLTEDADLHLLVDGKRVDTLERSGQTHVFRLGVRPRIVRIRSRAAVPQELGIARDDRALGVAVRRIVLAQSQRQRTIEADGASLVDGYHAFERDNGIRWTDGDAVVPAELFAGIDGPCMLMLHLGGATKYLDAGGSVRVA
jgi:hypothetical protein